MRSDRRVLVVQPPCWSTSGRPQRRGPCLVSRAIRGLRRDSFAVGCAAAKRSRSSELSSPYPTGAERHGTRRPPLSETRRDRRQCPMQRAMYRHLSRYRSALGSRFPLANRCGWSRARRRDSRHPYTASSLDLPVLRRRLRRRRNRGQSQPIRRANVRRARPSTNKSPASSSFSP